MKSKFIQAVSTPLASIFGSGFLVIIPVLAKATGTWMAVAMAFVTLFAYCVGSIIRFNITNAEPVIAAKSNKKTVFVEKFSDIAIVIAYVISVTLYLEILSSFLLEGFGIDSRHNEAITTTLIVAFIVFIAVTKGLSMLTKLETWALLITFILIISIILGFAQYDLQQSSFTLIPAPKTTPWEAITIVAGTLIVVQGFETPRYLGEEYDTETRVKSSRWSQIISTIVYLIFVSLSLPLLHELKGHYADNSLIQLVGFTIIPYVGIAVIIAAVLSQFSAAVADTITAEGNFYELTEKKVSPKITYIGIGILSIILAWFADTFQLIALASKAFAFYYLLQCIVALTISKSRVQKIGFSLVAAGLLFIVLFAVPAG